MTEAASHADIERYCRAVIIHCRAVAKEWKWDDWFGTALTEVEGERRDTVKQQLTEVFPECWEHAQTHANVSGIGDISRVIGGLQQKQLLLTTPLDRQPILLAAWWPWGGEAMVSVRITPYTLALDPAAQNFVNKNFRLWFEL